MTMTFFSVSPIIGWFKKQGKAFCVRFTLLTKYFVFLVHFFTENVAYQGCQINVDAAFQASLKLRNSKVCNAMTGTLQVS